MSPLCRGCWNGTPAAVKKQYHEIAESYVRGAGYRKPVKMRALGAAMRILIVAAKRALQERRDRRPARPKKINRQLGLSGLM